MNAFFGKRDFVLIEGAFFGFEIRSENSELVSLNSPGLWNKGVSRTYTEVLTAMGDKLHRREGNSPNHQLRPLNDRSVIKEVGVQRQPGDIIMLGRNILDQKEKLC
ncbi:hypothetical protein S245_014946 [Arachis hypogaea]